MNQELMALESQHREIISHTPDLQIGNYIQAQNGRFLQFVEDSGRGLLSFIPSLLNLRTNDFSSDYRLNSELGRSEYVALRDLQMQVPAGMNVSFLSYSEVLRRSTTWVNQMVVPTLISIDKYLNRAIGLQGFFDNSLPDPMSHRLAEIGTQCKDLKDQIAKCYDTSSNVTQSTYGRCFSRNKEWTEVSEIMVALTDQHDRIKTKEIIKLTKDISESCRALEKTFHDTPMGQRSEVKTKEVSSILFTAAQLVEFTGALIQMNITMIKVMEENKGMLLKIF